MTFEFLKLQAHLLVLLLHVFYVVIVHCHLSQPLVLIFKDVQLLANVAHVAFFSHDKQFLQVLDLSLQFLHKCIIFCIDFIALHSLHDTFSTVSKFESGDGLFNVFDNRGYSSNQVGRGITTDGILK